MRAIERVRSRASARAILLALLVAVAVPARAPASTPHGHGTLTLGDRVCDLIPVVPLNQIPGGIVSTGTCPGVRPGAIVQSSRGSCSFNFLFVGSNGRRYMGTAGHCILGDGPFNEDAGEKKWRAGKGPVARDASGKRIGEFAYAILKSPKDFALILLDKGVRASAQMCYFGGPTGINKDRTGPVILHHYGNGLATGDTLPARTAIATSLASGDHVFANGVAMPGDSGSGVISNDGRAVGVLVTLGVHKGSHIVDAGLIGITRIAPQIARAQKLLGITLTLKTAKRLSP